MDVIACCQLFCHISAACIQNCTGIIGIEPIALISGIPGKADPLPNDGMPGNVGIPGNVGMEPNEGIPGNDGISNLVPDFVASVACFSHMPITCSRACDCILAALCICFCVMSTNSAGQPTAFAASDIF